MPHEIEIVVPVGKKKERLDIFLTHHVQNATRSKVQRAIRSGSVLINGETARSSHQVTPGEVIRVTLPSPLPQDVLPENIPLEVSFEDVHLLVVNKPAGMVTHPAHGNYTGTLVNALTYHCQGLSAVNGPARAGIVHRLDKDTSGLMVVAKDDRAHAALARQFERRTIERTYWAVVWGLFRDREGIIEADLGRSRSDRKKMAVISGGKPAATEYRVLEEFSYLSLIQLRLRTGRTHQIRVHLSHVHHPVFGDPTYSGRRIMWGERTPRQRAEVQTLLKVLPRQALHAKTIGFLHPATGKQMRFESEPPEDFLSILHFLRGFEERG